MDAKTQIKQLTEKFSFEEVKELLNKSSNLKVLVIGDTIIDRYTLVETIGKGEKDPILAAKFEGQEDHAGAILAIANHLSSFVSQIHLVTTLGENDPMNTFVQNSLQSNISTKFFFRNDGPTTIKQRFVDGYRENKLFRIEYMNDAHISDTLNQEIVAYLSQAIQEYDLVVVGDFGHGLLTPQIINVIQEKAKFLAVNAQSNTANMGYNLMNRYNKPNFMTMDEHEIRLPNRMKFQEIDEVISATFQKFNFSEFIITQGRKGSTFVKEGKLFKAPIVTNSKVDATGAGDALFAVTSLLSYQAADPSLIPFIGNIAGGIVANMLGNQEPINKEAMLKYLEEIYDKHAAVDVQEYFSALIGTINNLKKKDVSQFANILLNAYHNGNTVFAFGNGGSGATASHFCGDLVKGVSYTLDKRFKAICLNDNMPALMAIANDISYDDIFIEQLKNFLKPGDVVVGISGSGNSANVVKALEYAKQNGAVTAAICGYSGGKIKQIADHAVHAEIEDMEISEDVHNIIMVHCVKRVLMNELGILSDEKCGEKYMERLDVPNNITNEAQIQNHKPFSNQF